MSDLISAVQVDRYAVATVTKTSAEDRAGKPSFSEILDTTQATHRNGRGQLHHQHDFLGRSLDKADVNGDGVINPLDVGYVLARMGQTLQDEGDVNGDGIVDQADVDAISENYGSDNMAYDVNGDGVVDPLDAGVALANLGLTQDGDANGDGVVDDKDLRIVDLAMRLGQRHSDHA